MAAAPAADAQMSFTGYVGSQPTSGGPASAGGSLSFGTLTPLPADITFTDYLGSTPESITDTWTFSFATNASGGGSVTGDALYLRSLSLSGIIDQVTVVDQTTSQTLYNSGMLSSSVSVPYFLGDSTPGDVYAITVASTVPTGSAAASYTGVLLADAIPEPGRWQLLAAGAGALALALRLRSRRDAHGAARLRAA